MLSSLPRCFLVPGLGCITVGADARATRVSAEIAARSHSVTARVLDAFGVVDWLTERDVFDFEYWPLELYKLQSAPAPCELSGYVAIVSDAGSELGRVVATCLLREGAHLVLVGHDADALKQIAAGCPGMVEIAGSDPVTSAIAAFGGVDILVALDPIACDGLDRLGLALQRQGMVGVVIGLDTINDTTVDLRHPLEDRLRTNIVRVENGAAPSMVAEAIVFLASPHAAFTDGSILSVGSGLAYT